MIGLMSETYQSKRERRQRLLSSLPAGLREHVSLRNVQAVAALPQPAQERLAEAIRGGLKRLPRAIHQLKRDPHVAIADLLHPPVLLTAESASASPASTHIQKELADLIQTCFPDMPRVSAEALAHSDVLDLARNTAHLFQQVLRSDHLRTDFVMLVLYGLMRRSVEQLEEVIGQTPALQQAFHQSPTPWKPNDWRK
jgi:hypothetical protein